MYLYILLSLIVIFLLVVLLKRPKKFANWTEIHKKTPDIKISNNLVNIKNINDFTYFEDGEIKEIKYIESNYNIDSVVSVWYGIAHFAKYGIAHSFLSFEFEDGQYLVTSIEARRKSQQKFSPVKGLFKAYNKTIVFGTENDLIGLRTHYLKHKVYLYPLDLETLQPQNLFKALVDESIKLEKQPEFYNTLVDNCFTSIAKYSNKFNAFRFLFDYRAVLPGHSDTLAQKWGLLDTSLSIQELRQLSKLNPKDSNPTNKDFSQQIRKNYRI
ncbi:DUF4105 domain-containing protein [Marinicellulosiphila megalodicopiae]|uniref:lipoprotein N-acyltransferase Lnb domain-containing protein n=1 Tax=Marinicellulosiphila megalodicopiae TaxID=2724896 RepID=UPI003BAE1BD2